MRNTRQGFTLLETIIYIGLFALLIAGTIPTVYQILESASQLSGKTTVQNEESFVLRKFDWALGGIDSSQSYYPASGSSGTLTLHRHDGTSVAMRLSGGKIEMSEDGGSTYMPITTDNVSVTALSFKYQAPSGSGPAGLSLLMTIDGFEASTTKYFRE